MTSAAQEAWEAENSILTIDPAQNALYSYDADAAKEVNAARPWSQKPDYFANCRISALALIKMTTHARSGGNLEIMGLMTGYTSGTSIIVTDAFRLPVEGTETRVNAQDEAGEYMVNYLTASREGGGRAENAVGWYHSHPGYGCWLSGIDVNTQFSQQAFSDPFVAVVIDPDRTVSAGKVEIGAFRTYPDNYHKKPNSQANPARTTSGYGDDDDDFQPIPASKMEDFGAHASSYYSLQVSHFKSTLDTHLLSLLWNKYWVATLAQSPLYTNRDYINTQISEHANKIGEAARRAKSVAYGSSTSGGGSSSSVSAHPSTIGGLMGSGGGGSGSINGSILRPRNEIIGLQPGQLRLCRDQKMDQLVRGGNQIAQEEMAGVMAARIKERLFFGIFDEVERLDHQQQQQQQEERQGKESQMQEETTVSSR